MTQRVDRPYWFHWLRWHLIDQFRRNKAKQRRATWDFANQVRRMPPGSIAIDCGANIGRITGVFVRHGFQVHAFEPDPFARGILEERFGAHPLVTIHPEAVGAAPSRVTLYRKAEFRDRPRKATISSSLLRRNVHGDRDAVEVDVIDLAAFVRSLDRPVDLLKIDIEGAEVEVLDHLIDEGTHDRIGMIYVETHERHSSALNESTMRLRQRIAEERIANINLDWR